MRLPAYLLGLVYFASELLLVITRRSRKIDSSAKDRNSLRFLWITILVSLWAGIQVAASWPAAALPHKYMFASAGLVFFIIGIALRWYPIVKLGRFFTVNVAIAKDHQLVESGPYRFVRHPSYTGALLAFLGFGLSLGNWADRNHHPGADFCGVCLPDAGRGTRSDCRARRTIPFLPSPDETADPAYILRAESQGVASRGQPPTPRLLRKLFASGRRTKDVSRGEC